MNDTNVDYKLGFPQLTHADVPTGLQTLRLKSARLHKSLKHHCEIFCEIIGTDQVVYLAFPNPLKFKWSRPALIKFLDCFPHMGLPYSIDDVPEWLNAYQGKTFRAEVFLPKIGTSTMLNAKIETIKAEVQ